MRGFILGALTVIVILAIIFWPITDFFIRAFLNKIFYGRNGLW